MLAYQVDGQQQQRGSGADFLQRLRAHPQHWAELGELGEVLEVRSVLRTQSIYWKLSVPLTVRLFQEFSVLRGM